MARRHSAAVYRRRRLGLIGGILLLVAAVGVGVWLLIAQPWANAAGEPERTPSPPASTIDTPTPEQTGGAESPSPKPSDDETSGAVPCRATDVDVVAVTDAEAYDPDVLPQLSIALTNNGSADCTIDVGSSTQVFTVSSGSDTWWRSTDCQENPSNMVVTLTAGQTVTSATPVEWDRTRSSVDTCEQEDRPRAPGGGASYHVAVSIGGFAGVSSQQILLY